MQLRLYPSGMLSAGAADFTGRHQTSQGHCTALTATQPNSKSSSTPRIGLGVKHTACPCSHTSDCKGLANKHDAARHAQGLLCNEDGRPFTAVSALPMADSEGTAAGNPIQASGPGFTQSAGA